MSNRRRAAFTLTELLVVIAIMLILMSILIVTTSEVWSSAERLRCQQNLEQLSNACILWSSRNSGREMAAAVTVDNHMMLWYKALLPYLSPTSSTSEASLVLNCPLVLRTISSSGLGTWGGGPNLLFSYDRYRTDMDFLDIINDLRNGGWPGVIQAWERHPRFQPGVFNPITSVIDDYGIFAYMNGWYSQNFTQDEKDAVREFQKSGRGILVSPDHAFDFCGESNELSDYCGWGLQCLGYAGHGPAGPFFPITTDHPIAAGVTGLHGYDSEGDIRIPTNPAKQNPFASIAVKCTLPASQHAVVPSGYPPLQCPCGIVGIMDDSKVRVAMDSSWTKFSVPGWYYTSTYKTAHFTFFKNMCNWLLERSSGTDQLSYGYNNQIGSMDPATGRIRPRPPRPSEVIRILDYEETIADHDLYPAVANDDPDSYTSARHGGRVNVLFMDGHVEGLTPDRVRSNNWSLWQVKR